jgi:hypothetical protein
MNTHIHRLGRSGSIAVAPDRARRIANDDGRTSQSRIAARTITLARRRRERVLACLAFLMLIVAWDATLRLDEQMAPPRMRMSHAVESEVEGQRLAYSPDQ